MRQISPPAAAPLFVPSQVFFARIEPGETVVVMTNRGADVPTGPLEVVGAGPGDVLAVHVLDVRPKAGAGVLVRTDPMARLLPARFGDEAGTVRREVALAAGCLRIGQVSVPIRPVVGLIEALPMGEPVPSHNARSFWPWRYGGDLGCAQIAAGVTVYLPVAVAGGGLSVGNVLAAIGDGTLTAAGAEAPGEVELRVEVLPGRRLRWPVVETDDELLIVASARTMAEAARLALEDAAELSGRRLRITFEEAGMLLSLAGDLRLCQTWHPYVTVRVAIPKSIVPGLA